MCESDWTDKYDKERTQCRGDEFMSRRGRRVQEEVPSDCEA